ncbi:MAG: hypothetical protein LBL04_13060 [Bacteroidales bacterium]|jgi:hypothetical protein|nr:hypothetical protein [Bacteroidales bacterium]
MKNVNKKVSVVTVTLECEADDAPEKKHRDEILKKVVQTFGKEDIILLPAGFYDVTDSKEEIRTTEEISRLLSETKSKSVVCLGIDVGNDTQLAVAIDKSGIRAKGRKFFPTDEEKKYLNSAKSFDSREPEFFDNGEPGHGRFVECKGKQFYLAVCYDSYGIREYEISKPEKTNAVLNLVHGFTRSGEGSGISYFIRYGFGGGSRHWKCPVFGAAVLFNREVPKRWQPGFKCREGVENLQSITYADNLLEYSKQDCNISTEYEKAFCWLSTI